MPKKFRKEHTISFAVTLPQKQHIIKEAEKSGLRLSRFISETIEEKIGQPSKEEIETANIESPTQE